MTYDINYFIEALERLNYKLVQTKSEEELDVYIIGGFCMMLHGLRDATIDIDSYISEYAGTNLKRLIEEVGEEIGNPEWLNDDITKLDTIPQLSDLLIVVNSFRLERKIGKINVYAAELKTILITKILAVMDERDNYYKDIQDILSIISRTGFSEEVITSLREFEICNFDILSTLLSILTDYKYIDEADLLKYYELIKHAEEF